MTTRTQKLKHIDEKRQKLMNTISKAQNELVELGVERTNIIMGD